MADVPIKYKPTILPTNLTAAYKNHNTIAVSWKNPANAIKGTNNSRFNGNRVRVQQTTRTVSVDANGVAKYSSQSTYTYYVYPSIDLSQSGSYNWSLASSNYYPHSTKTIMSLVVGVCGKNNYGDGPYTTVNPGVSTPKSPTITASFDKTNGRATFTVKTDAGAGASERYDTVYWLERQDESTVDGGYKTATKVLNNQSRTDTSFTLTYDVIGHALLSKNQWTKITCKAFARGMCGPSPVVSRTIALYCPPEVTIEKITSDTSVSGRVYVYLNRGSFSNSKDKIDTLTLQRLYNTTIGVASTAAESDAWEDVPDAEDNGECRGFVDQKSDAVPEVRKHTWYRVVSNFGAITVQGPPFEAKVLYRTMDAQSSDAIKWQSIEAGDDGESIELRMGWATDNYTATEVTWSDRVDAWDSNEQPDNFILDWEDASPVGYQHTARFVIVGLEPGKPVYIRARRVTVDNGNITAKGEWCVPPAESYPLTPGAEASDVMLFAPSYVTKGEGIDLDWTYSGELMKSWTLYKIEGARYTILKTGTGPAGKCTVESAALKNLTSITLRLGIVSGSETVYSPDVTVAIYTVPTLTASTSATIYTKPVSVTLVTNRQSSEVKMRVVAVDDISPSAPDGSGRQLAGDVVWAGIATPSWTYSSSAYRGSIGIDAPFVDGGTYRVEATATDTTSGLTSEMAESEFTINWSHKATAPEATVSVDADALSATVSPIAPVGAVQADVCDVYRISNGKAYLIADGMAFGDSLTDELAPFSADGTGLAYRVSTRTINGDTDYSDVPYELASKNLVVNFGDDSVSLPWGIAKVDKWAKPFTQTQRWDGSIPGHWDGGAIRSASISGYVIKLTDPEAAAKVAALGEYIGPCFVRTPDGSAFPADVEVDSIGGSALSPVHPVSISATEVQMTDEFRVGVPGE